MLSLGRTSDNKIKIKTDGGLRAVGCACCGGGYGFPCADCPPVLGNWNFSFSGDQVTDVTEFEYVSVICPSNNCNYTGFPPIAPRVCDDSWDAFGSGPYGTSRLYMIQLTRAYGGFFGVPPGTPCCWVLSLYVQGIFEYPYEEGTDACSLSVSGQKVILGDNPVGTYPFTFEHQCMPPQMGGPTIFNFTVGVS